jgi:hypothetical protein
MPKKPRVVRQVDARAVRLAQAIDKVIDEHLGPNATFEEREEMAAAIVAEALAELRRAGT